MNRRNFIQQALAFTGVVALLPIISKAGERKSGAAAGATAGGLTLVDPKDPQAKALNYFENKNEIKNKALQVEKTGVKFSDQKCQSCAFFDKTKETKISGKSAAPCQLFPGKAVSVNGWCTSWAKKV